MSASPGTLEGRIPPHPTRTGLSPRFAGEERGGWAVLQAEPRDRHPLLPLTRCLLSRSLPCTRAGCPQRDRTRRPWPAAACTRRRRSSAGGTRSPGRGAPPAWAGCPAGAAHLVPKRLQDAGGASSAAARSFARKVPENPRRRCGAGRFLEDGFPRPCPWSQRLPAGTTERGSGCSGAHSCPLCPDGEVNSEGQGPGHRADLQTHESSAG